MSVLTMNGIVNVIVELNPIAVNTSGFNTGLILGTSAVIPLVDRVREYSNIEAMIEDGFTTNSPEYKAAQLYFAANRRPDKVFIGVKGESESYLDAITACRGASYEWYGFTADGVTNADILALGKFAESASPYTCYFYTTPFTQPEFNVQYSGGGGTYEEVTTNGEITIIFDSIPAMDPVGSEFVVEYNGEVLPTEFSYNNITGTVILRFEPVEEDIDVSIFATMASNSFFRSHGMYSSQANAVAAVMGYAMGANTQLSNSAYTLAYKNLPGVATSEISETLITSIKDTNGNVYVQRGGKYNVYEQGVQSNGAHFDDLIGVDTLANDVQTSAMNLLVNGTKLPYTDSGVTRIINAIVPDFEKARTVGFIAPGVWTGEPIYGNGGRVFLDTGDSLINGYALFADPVETVSQTQRESRVAPPIYAPVKLSGAIEHVVIQIKVNR